MATSESFRFFFPKKKMHAHSQYKILYEEDKTLYFKNFSNRIEKIKILFITRLHK